MMLSDLIIKVFHKNNVEPQTSFSFQIKVPFPSILILILIQ